jgi:hypothetical protein
MTSDCRGEAKALHIPTGHRRLHHFHGAAGKPKGHPHQRTRARPIDERIRAGHKKSLVLELCIERAEIRIIW